MRLPNISLADLANDSYHRGTLEAGEDDFEVDQYSYNLAWASARSIAEVTHNEDGEFITGLDLKSKRGPFLLIRDAPSSFDEGGRMLTIVGSEDNIDETFPLIGDNIRLKRLYEAASRLEYLTGIFVDQARAKKPRPSRS